MIFPNGLADLLGMKLLKLENCQSNAPARALFVSWLGGDAQRKWKKIICKGHIT